jgi:phage shock protein B
MGIGFSEFFVMTAIVLVFLFPFVLLGFLGWLAVRVLGGSGKPDAQREEEVRLMQELHHGMKRLETRVESLETILLEREAEIKEMHR